MSDNSNQQTAIPNLVKSSYHLSVKLNITFILEKNPKNNIHDGRKVEACVSVLMSQVKCCGARSFYPETEGLHLRQDRGFQTKADWPVRHKCHRVFQAGSGLVEASWHHGWDTKHSTCCRPLVLSAH